MEPTEGIGTKGSAHVLTPSTPVITPSVRPVGLLSEGSASLIGKIWRAGSGLLSPSCLLPPTRPPTAARTLVRSSCAHQAPIASHWLCTQDRVAGGPTYLGSRHPRVYWRLHDEDPEVAGSNSLMAPGPPPSRRQLTRTHS